MTRRCHDRIKNGREQTVRCGQVAVAISFLLVGACASAAPLPTSSTKRGEHLVDSRTAADIRARTGSVTERAILCKPHPSAEGGFDITQAPLFVVDIPAADGTSGMSPRPTDLPVLAGRELYADLSRVYLDRTNIRIAGSSYAQVIYAWKCVAFPDPGVRRVEGRICGVRATLSPDGRPLVWETLDHPRHDVVYVSKSFEDAAKTRYGEPLPGQSFVAERSRQEAPATVIARVLDDGPLPLGPYVYLAARAEGITTLLCRCSPSQMNEVIETADYQLRNADELGPGWQARLLSATAKPLDQRLRWPYP